MKAAERSTPRVMGRFGRVYWGILDPIVAQLGQKIGIKMSGSHELRDRDVVRLQSSPMNKESKSSKSINNFQMESKGSGGIESLSPLIVSVIAGARGICRLDLKGAFEFIHRVEKEYKVTEKKSKKVQKYKR